MSRADNYEFIKVIGAGGFASVELWKQRIGAGDLVVAKRVYVGDMTKAEVEQAREEARVLKALKHPHIVHYIGSWVHRQEQDLLIVQEYCAGGDLKDLLKDRKEKLEHISETQVLKWLSQLGHALQYCHKKCHILHRDLKPTNVFLSEDHSDVMLGDFGIAKSLGSTASLCKTFIGTQAYMSPEVTRLQNYGSKSDVWGLGAVIYECCTLSLLYGHNNLMTLMQSVASPEDAPSLRADSGYSAELKEVLDAMLIKDATARPSFDQLFDKYALLRLSVLHLERTMGWEDSLVPAQEQLDPLPENAPEKLREVFRRFDSSGNGQISRGDLAVLLHTLNDSWDTGVANLLIEAADANGDQCIDYEEFVDWLLAGSDEWDEVRHALLQPMDALDELEPTAAGSTNFPQRQAWEEPHGQGSLAEAAAEARQRLLAGVQAQDSEAKLLEAAEVKDLVQLTMRQKELEELLQKSPAPEPELESLCSLHTPWHSPNFSAFSVSQLKEYITQHGGSLLGITDKAELIALCIELHGPDAKTPVLEETLQQKAAQKLDARLRCVDILQTETPDPVELAIALRQAKRLELGQEPCGKALLSHSERLGLHAEDVTDWKFSDVEAIEGAVEILEALKHAADLLGGSTHTSVSPNALNRANTRLQQARTAKMQLGVRTQNGPFFKTLSLRADHRWEQVQSQIAQHWGRPLEALSFFGPDSAQLMSEEDWEACVRSSRGGGPVEVRLVLDRAKLAPQKVRRSRATRKQQTGTSPKAAAAAESVRPKTSGGRAKKSLAGLAASGQHWRSVPGN